MSQSRLFDPLRRGASSAALCVALAACASATPDVPVAPAAEIPVRRVVLYQNGVGYFERAGKVDGDVLTLQIRPSQINDLLKSLTVIDRGSGRAVSVSLPLEEAADRILNELPEQVRNAGGLLEVLRVFRGAHVTVEGSEGERTGRVIGVENLQTEAGEDVEADWRVSLKTSDDEVVVYPVKAISRVQLYDKTLSVGLERSLDVSLGEGGWKPIALSIRLAGDGPHDLLASYIVEMPRWKPAYRLVLDAGQKPLLQGWAAVDNVSGEDWANVGLSLVSGTPISFKYNLHAPQYSERVDLTPAGLPRAEAPPPSEAPGVEGKEKESLQRRYAAKRAASDSKDGDTAYELDEESMSAPPQAPAPSAEAYGAGAGMAAPAATMALGAMIEQQATEAEATKVGALFRYDIKDPVTIPDRSSTLVSIVNQRITGEEVVYFRPELTAHLVQSHPYRAVKFTNGTGFTLEKGPITVYSSGTFVGEGFVERMESAETSFLTFAIDGNVLLDTHGGSREEGLRLVRIVDGVIISEVQEVESTTYEVENRHATRTAAYIRTEKRPGWTLKQKPAGTVETSEAMIVPVDVPAKGNAKLVIEWSKAKTTNMEVDSSNTEELFRLYLAGGKVPAEIKKPLQEILAIKAEINETGKEEDRLRALHEAQSRDQDRVRANLQTLKKTQGNHALKQDLAKKLGKLEEELGKLSGRLVQLSERRAELGARMRALIKTISL